MSKYKVTTEQKKNFASIYLLNYMINTPKTIPIILEGNDEDLETLLEFMHMKKYIEIKDDAKYIPTDKGHELLVRFSRRYQDFLRNFDIYCSVDLEKGIFAFEKFIEYAEKPEEWSKYLDDDKWEDLRICVAEYKKLDPVEIVFMSFINEGNFGKTKEGWQFDLLLGSVWDDIIDICNNALHSDDLGFEDDEGYVSGKDVIEDIMNQATELNIYLAEEAEKYDAELYSNKFADEDEEADEDTYVEVVEYEEIGYDVYEGYYSPAYVSPVWLIPLFLF